MHASLYQTTNLGIPNADLEPSHSLALLTSPHNLCFISARTYVCTKICTYKYTNMHACTYKCMYQRIPFVIAPLDMWDAGAALTALNPL